MATSGLMPQQQLIDLLAGYWRAKVVQVFASLGLADRFARETRTVAELAAAIGASEDGLARLLRAAEHCGLVAQQADACYALTVLGASLRDGVAGSMRYYAMALAGPAHWQSWQQLEQAVVRGAPVAADALGRELWDHFSERPDEAQCFADAMGELSALVGLDLATPAELAGLRTIVDVGGSRGVLLSALLKRAPDARGIVCDRADVIANAPQGVDARLQFVTADFFTQVPAGGDLYLLKQILHDYDDAACRRILRVLADAAAPGTPLWIVEMLVPSHGDAGLAALVDLNMLILFGGRERTLDDYVALLDSSGWEFKDESALRGGFHRLRAQCREAG